MLYSGGAPFEFQPEYRLPWGTRWCRWLRHCATSRKVAGSILNCVIRIFHLHNPSAALWPWGYSAFNRNEFQEYFLRGKGGRCVGLTTSYHPHVSIVFKSGSLGHLEPSGSVQACHGFALLYTDYRVSPHRPWWLQFLGIVPDVRSRPLRSTFFTIHDSMNHSVSSIIRVLDYVVRRTSKRRSVKLKTVKSSVRSAVLMIAHDESHYLVIEIYAG